MKLIIKPDQPTMDLMIETAQYQAMWRQYSRRIMRAFREVTGLEFQRYSITARVSKVDISTAGRYHVPMRLSGDGRAREDKLLTIVHELGHRLLSSNSLGAEHLHGFTDNELHGEKYIVAEHFNLYLFEYDVITLALGSDYARRCIAWEYQDDPSDDDGHVKAWKRAMALPYTERQKLLAALRAKAIPREQWHQYDDDGNLLPQYADATVE